MRPKTRVTAVATAVAWLAVASWANCQNTAGIGTRALGMAGAFTAVADDASAVYWNPAGTATGALASLVVDWGTHDSTSHDDDRSAPAVRGSGTLVALTLPVVGVGYYRLDVSALGPAEGLVDATGGRSPVRRAEALVTDNLVLTLAQTLVDRLHVGLAVRAVRGRAGEAAFSGPDLESGADDLLDDVEGRVSGADTEFDADLGLMLDWQKVRVGVSARNLMEPSFRTDIPDGDRQLPRLVRAGVAVLPRAGLVLALDAGLTTRSAVDGRWRPLAVGAEMWTLSRRFGVRGGLSVQTVDAARPAVSVGASALVWKGLGLDAQVTGGSDGAGPGWSLGGRFTY
jgi:long-chain fatty acid transport protein